MPERQELILHGLAWREGYDDRQRTQIDECLRYNPTAGLPGHSLMLLVAKMATQLNDYAVAVATLPADTKAALVAQGWHSAEQCPANAATHFASIEEG